MTNLVPPIPVSPEHSFGPDASTADCAARTAAELPATSPSATQMAWSADCHHDAGPMSEPQRLSGQFDGELEELLREVLAQPNYRNDDEQKSWKVAETAALADAGVHQEVASSKEESKKQVNKEEEVSFLPDQGDAPSSPLLTQTTPGSEVEEKTKKPPTSKFVIMPAHAVNLLNARDFASVVGTPLNAAFVANMVGSTFYPGGKPTKEITRQCRERAIAILRDLAAENGYASTYIYTFENPPTGGTGLHVNFLLHLPENEHAKLRQAIQQRFEMVFAWKPRKGSFKPFQIDQKILSQIDVANKLIYALKGVYDVAGTYSRAGGEGPELQGKVLAKRVGCSKNIDKGARRAARYTDETDRGTQLAYMNQSTLADLNVNSFLRKYRERRNAHVSARLRRAWSTAIWAQPTEAAQQGSGATD